MMETPVTFKSSGEQIVGMLHLPERRRGRVPGVVFFHGFTGTKVEPHRMFVKMARALAEAGIASLRFDFRGSGDSAGDFSQMTVSSEIRDAETALAWMRQRVEIDPKRVGVLGMSMGGMIAALLLGRDPKIAVAVLWAPVSHPKQSRDKRLTPEGRKQLETMGLVDDRGNAVGKEFLDDIVRHQPLAAIARTRAPVLLIHGDEDETIPVFASHAYEAALKKARRAVAKHIIKGAGHTFSSLAWETELLAISLGWFRCNLGCA